MGRRGLLTSLVLSLLAVIPRLAAPSAAAACSSAPIPFDRVLASAGPVLVVRVVGIRGPADSPDGLTLAIEEAWRGTAPPVLDLEPPVATACGDRVWARVGERLILALDVPAFDGLPPLAAYWAVLDDGMLEPRSGETPAGVTTLAGLRDTVARQSPEEPATSGGASSGTPVLAALAVLGIATLVLAGIVTFLVRRRASPP